jgi:hypothetical protein
LRCCYRRAPGIRE